MQYLIYKKKKKKKKKKISHIEGKKFGKRPIRDVKSVIINASYNNVPQQSIALVEQQQPYIRLTLLATCVAIGHARLLCFRFRKKKVRVYGE